MKGYRYRRLLLFLAILILPTVAIVIQGRMIAARDLEIARTQSAQRVEDTRKRIAAEVGQEMVSRLESIKGQEVANAAGAIPQPGTYSGPAVVIVGRVDGMNVKWPWNRYTNPEPFMTMKEPKWDGLADQAIHAEFVEKDDKRASALYGELTEFQPIRNAQLAYARLGLARTLRRSGGQQEAIAIYLKVLKTRSDILDESGVSFASSAAAALTELHTAGGEVLARLRTELESREAMIPVQTDRWKSILEMLQRSDDPAIRENAGTSLKEVLKRAGNLEDARSVQAFQDLQRDFPKLKVTADKWQFYRGTNDELWLVGRAANRSTPFAPPNSIAFSPDGRLLVFSRAAIDSEADLTNFALPLVVVVRAEEVRASIASDRAAHGDPTKFQINAKGVGEPLGEQQLPGLRVTLPELEAAATAGPGLRRSFYGWSLLFVVPFTFLGGYLLWRDTRREVRIAELRSQFVSNVSHELKTPLTAIRMFAEALQMKYATDPAVHKEYLDTIVNESERLTRLLNNVLDFSRIDRSQKNYQMEMLPLGEVVYAAAQTMQYPFAEQGFRLGLTIIDDGIPPVLIDRDAILQAILNLLTNAMKYSGKSRTIELQLSAENGSAIIRVTDHGIGIPADEQKRIFEKFYRSPIPENQAIAGTGIGLALVAHIVEAHGGTVQVQSKPGEGSTFSIHLPIHGRSVV
jgi:signal transduction histidine kinase